MKVIVTINNCGQCKHSSHTGAFTKNGALADCKHPNAASNFTMSDHTGDNEDRNWKIAKRDGNEIPKWCPMANGAPSYFNVKGLSL